MNELLPEEIIEQPLPLFFKIIGIIVVPLTVGCLSVALAFLILTILIEFKLEEIINYSIVIFVVWAMGAALILGFHVFLTQK